MRKVTVQITFAKLIQLLGLSVDQQKELGFCPMSIIEAAIKESAEIDDAIEDVQQRINNNQQNKTYAQG